MPFVDPEFVAAALRPMLPATLTLVPEDAEDEDMEDGSVNVMVAGVRRCAVQVNPGYLGLNTYGQTDPEDPRTFWMRNHGTWGVQPEDLRQVAAAVVALVSTQ